MQNNDRSLFAILSSNAFQAVITVKTVNRLLRFSAVHLKRVSCIVFTVEYLNSLSLSTKSHELIKQTPVLGIQEKTYGNKYHLLSSSYLENY